jgi:GntR family transcriptional regulator
VIFRINPHSGVPIYLQLLEQVRHAIESGVLRPGEQLPGIRRVAEDMVMNPNTVAKAYREMEHAGLIVLRHGAGAFVAGHHPVPQTRAVQRARAVVQRAISSLRDLGLDEGAIRRLVESELDHRLEETRK